MSTINLDRVREVRATRPQVIREAAQTRRRGPRVAADGRLMLVAADHPARGALGVRSESRAMESRRSLLERLVEALSRPGVDGVLGSADILEDLLLLGALEGKAVFASMNRGGLLGSSFEMDDRFTAFDAETIEAMRFDGGKMLTRINPSDAGTVSTLEACGRAVSDLARRDLVAMIEPFMSERVDGRIKNDLTSDAVTLSMAIAGGLGASSAYTWLKIPVVDDMERVMEATTLPTLLLGGDPTAAPEETYAKWATAVAQPGVLGLVVGRALLYPQDGDVTQAVDTAVSLVHANVASLNAGVGE
ncbi:MAG: aldolase [Actinomycetales bacterium]|nr:aldolase [Actinomycetales bacterium]